MNICLSVATLLLKRKQERAVKKIFIYLYKTFLLFFLNFIYETINFEKEKIDIRRFPNRGGFV